MIPPEVPGYALDELLGRGGMGVVFAGRHLASGRQVAIKVLPEERAASVDRVRFEREYAAMRAVRSPFLCEAFEFGALETGELYLVMQRLVGVDLGARLKRGAVPLADALRIAGELARGLDALHAAGLVHRDVKPSNVFLDISLDVSAPVRAAAAPPTPGSPAADGLGPVEIVRLLDFGVAAFRGDQARITRTGDILGTPAYMAPEQARGGSPEARSDLYSLGAVLFHLLTGAPPHGGENAVVILLRMLSEPVPPLSRLRPDLSPALAGLVDQLLSSEVSARPASATEVAERLDALAEGEAGATLRPGTLSTGRMRPVGTLVEEQRLVTLLIAEGARDRRAVQAAIRRHGGVPVLGDGRDFGLFGASGSEGDELSRARAAAEEVRLMVVKVEVGHGRVTGHDGHVSGNLQLIADALVTGTSPLRGASADLAPAGESLPFVGREGELAELLAADERVRDTGELGAVLLTGAAGVGKSRLVTAALERLRARHPNLQVLTGRGESTRRFASWRALGFALRELVLPSDTVQTRPASLSGLSEEAHAFLRAALGEAVEAPPARFLEALREPKLMHDQIVGALGDIVDSAAHRGPLVLVLEDVHWVDTPSLEAIDALLRREGVPLLVVLTGRPQAVDQRPELFRAPSLDVRRVRELGPKPSERLVDAAFLARGAAADPEVRQALVEHAGGNPFFLAELCEHVLAGRAAPSSAVAPGAQALPVNVEAAVQARLDQLAGEDRQVLRRASVLGVRFGMEGLLALGSEESTASLERLERAGLLVRGRRDPRGDFAFRQRVVREVAYGSLTEAQRMHLHGLAGAWLLEAPDAAPEDVAQHLREARDPRAGAFWERSATCALASGDLVAARDRLQLSLETAESPHDVARIEVMRLSVAFDLRDGALVDRVLATLESCSLEPAQQGRVDYYRGRRLTARADGPGGAAALEAAERAFAGAGDSDYLTRTLAARALNALYQQGPEARALAVRAVETSPGTPPAAQQAALHAKYHVLIRAGELTVALDTARACEELAQVSGDLSRRLAALGDVAYVAGRLGRHEEARAALETVVVEGRKRGNTVAVAWALHNLGLCRLHLGDARAALADEAAALDLAQRVGELLLARYARLYLARIHLARGELREARAHVSALFDGREDDARYDGEVVMAAVELAEGRPEAALERARAAAATVAARHSELEAERDVVELDALVALGRVDELRPLLDSARARLAQRAVAAADEGVARDTFFSATLAHRRLVDWPV